MNRSAIFVDFENLKFGVPRTLSQTDFAVEVIDRMMQGKLGDHNPVICRAYADWENITRVPAALNLRGFTPVYVTGFHGKNSADLEMSLDCQELFLKREDINAVVLVTGDRDFLPLAKRVVEHGLGLVVASFSRTLSADLRKFAERHEFIDLDQFVPKEALMSESDDADEKLIVVMRQVVKADRKYNDKEIWLVPFLKEYLNPALPDEDNDGRKDLLSHLEARAIVAIEQRQDNSGKNNSYSVIIPDREHPLYKRAALLVDSV